MKWKPITLSGKHRKSADRRFGAEIILPWPPGLPPPTDLGEDDERPATTEERGAAVQILSRETDLVVVRVYAAVLRRPTSLGGSVEPHLIAWTVGRRWLGTTLRERQAHGGRECWFAGAIEALE